MKVIKAEDTRSLEPFRDRIIEGDCLEVMKDIPGESIDTKTYAFSIRRSLLTIRR